MTNDLLGRIEEWRRKLLDLTNRNQLVSCKMGPRAAIRLEYPSPGQVWNGILGGADLTFAWKRELVPEANESGDDNNAPPQLSLFASKGEGPPPVEPRITLEQGLGSFAITDGERIGFFISYGWESGLGGDFNDARIESLANQTITVTPTIADATHRYPAALLTLITAQLAIVNTNQPLATGGSAQGATAARDAALVLRQVVNARVRFFYCSASDETDQSAELVSIGRQPRRDAGAAAAQPLPAAPGPATFDAVALSLTVSALPDHATTLRAFRRPAGGTAELASTSGTTTVSLTDLGPLTTGVTYEFWLVGHNSQGNGPQSNHVSHVAT